MQMPPTFGPKNLGDLKMYLESFPKDIPLAIELRHPDWFENSPTYDDLYPVLKSNNISTVITDTAGRRDVLNPRLSTPVAFIRFVGNNLHQTDYTLSLIHI